MKPLRFGAGIALAVLVLWSSPWLRQSAAQQPVQPPMPKYALGAADVFNLELLKKSATAKAAAERVTGLLGSYETFVQLRTKAALAAAEAASAAQANAFRANAEKDAAARVLALTKKDNQTAYAAAEQKLADKTAAAQAATAKAETARKTAELTQAVKVAAEKQYAAQTKPLRGILNEAALAEAAAFGGLKPLDPAAWDYDKARHLLVRAGFGGTPEEVAHIHSLGLHVAVAYLVDYHKQPSLPLPFEAVLPERPQPEEVFHNPQQINALKFRRQNADTTQLRRLREWWFQRMLKSPRPLQEKLTLFWHGHFTSEAATVKNSYALYRQNELFREHADNFAALLFGIIHDPAMLRYLDNNTNVKGKPNENLAREIMELFSMGEGKGYTEKDIMEAARSLTGYTFDSYTCQFRFLAQNHDPQPKTIFGKKGNWNGEDFVELILHQPATSRFIAGKLFAFFAYEKPPTEVVEHLATLLRRRDYDLGPMLKNLFLSEEFYSPKAMGTQIKSPVQLVVGMYRELGYKDVNTQTFEFPVRSMGQDLFDPPNVRGWEGGRTWINANVLITRYNQLANLVERQVFIPGQPFNRNQPVGQLDVVGLLKGLEFKTPAEVLDHLAKRHLAVPIAPEKRKELLAFLGDLPPSSQWDNQRIMVNAKLRGLLALLFATPEFQMT